MRWLPVVLLVACGKKPAEEELPPPITFADSVKASGIEAELDPESANLLATWGAVGQFVDLLLSDNTVKSTFFVDGDLGTAPLAYYFACWSAPSPGTAGFEYDLDLTGCSSEGFDGTIHVENTPQGPIVLTFNGTIFLDWAFAGSLAFEYQADRTWKVYPSDVDANPVASLPITTGSGLVDLVVDATVNLTSGPSGNSIKWLGTAGDGTRTVTIGLGTEVVYGQQPAACSCPTEGSVSTEFIPVLSALEVDLDDLAVESDGDDDPALIFEVSGAPSGTAVLATGPTCGTHAVTFGGFDLVLSSADLLAGVESSCSGGVFDSGTCTRLREAANAATEVTVEVPALQVDNALTSDANDRFDEGICFTGY